MGLFFISSAVAALPQSVEMPVHQVSVTAYNAVPAQTKADPSTTANGGPSNPEVVAARSRDLATELPFGTIIAIDSPITDSPNCGLEKVHSRIGYRVITDTMNARIVNTIDILFGIKENYVMPNGVTKNAANVLGICEGVTIRVVGYIDLTRVHDLPKTQAELAALVESGSLALAK